MTTGLQFALAGGALVGSGIACLLWRLAPAEPDLADVVHRYSPAGSKSRTLDTTAAGSTSDKVGLWAIRRLPAAWWGKTPTKELALLRVPVHRHYGKKVLQAAAGLTLPPLLSYFFILLGWPIPFYVPLLGSLALAAILFFAPDLDVRTDARRARAEFARSLVAYTDLVALERVAGSGARQAMELAAEIGDSWVFQRIGEELARSRWSGLAPWDALHALADELGLPELDDLADIMRLSKEGSQVYSQLRARSNALRSAILNDELANANAVNDRMDMPMAMLGIVFMVILIAPQLLRVSFGS